MATFISRSPDETFALGERWGKAAKPGWVIGLTGDLGAGKTQLVKGIAHGLGIAARVQSPTFALVQEYPCGRLPLAHLDLYRLDTPEQIIGAGLEPYFHPPSGVTVVEWCERWPAFPLTSPLTPRTSPLPPLPSACASSVSPRRPKPNGASIMKILAIEFSSETRSAALVEAGQVLGFAEQTGGRTARGLELVEAAVRGAGLEREHVECIAVGLGPGSYAGIRAAIALAQGWQLACALLTLGLSSAECVAERARIAGLRGDADVLIDAQRGEFYHARCTLHDHGTEIQPMSLLGPDAARALTRRALLVEPALLSAFPGALAMWPDAATLGGLAGRREDFTSADRLEPIYLREAAFVKAPPLRVVL